MKENFKKWEIYIVILYRNRRFYIKYYSSARRFISSEIIIVK